MSRPEQTLFQPQPSETTQERIVPNNQLEDKLPHDKQGRIAWKQMSQEKIISYFEAKANLLLDEKKRLIQDELIKTDKMGWFIRAVYKFYPGGLSELKKKSNQLVTHLTHLHRTKEMR